MNYIGNKEKLRRTNQKIVHLKRELKKKDKVIDEMASRLSYVEDLKLDVCVYCKEDCRIPRNEGDFIKTDCIKEYFYEKVSE